MAIALHSKSKCVKMGFKYPVQASTQPRLADGMRELYKQRVLCDAELVSCSDRFPCHKVVLAAKSPKFAEVFVRDAETATRTEVRVYDASPEAVSLLLNYMYESEAEYEPRSQQVNLEVLQLADSFDLPHLKEVCASFMAKEVTTETVIETICACVKYGLAKLRERLLAQLTGNKKALQDLASAPQIMQYPELMRELLTLLAHDGHPDQPASKKARK